MIIPHASDRLVSAMVYSSPMGPAHRTVLFRREHPGRRDQYILIQEREGDSSKSVQRTVLDRDITDVLHHMASNNSVSILSRYLFFRFKDEPTVSELVEIGKEESPLKRDLHLIFDLELEDLENVISWKP